MAVRVLVVEDSLTVRKHLVGVLVGAELDVVAEASDGKAAIELCERLRPDVVTMDMVLPVMSGLAATEYIMAYCPTPILIVSASTNRGDVYRTYDALAAGAVDILEKPGDADPDAEWDRRLVAAIRLVSRVRVVTHLRGRLGGMRTSHPASLVPGQPELSVWPQVVAVGPSTGGPSALLTVLASLPAEIVQPILVVLHISPAFAEGLVRWLDAQLVLDVRYAEGGERLGALPPGSVLMARPDRHLEVSPAMRLQLSDRAERHSCRPSVDVLFESLAAHHGPHTVACLLTGMGRDGAQGLLAIRDRAGFTLAQDEASSVVFGMPGAAIELGAATHVLPLGKIGPTIARVCSQDAASGESR